VLAEGCVDQPLVLHADNGSPMKGETLLETLYRLGIATSYSRPRTSNDNPYSEALFRTCKYCPAYPTQGFAGLQEARAWMQQFVYGYNHDAIVVFASLPRSSATAARIRPSLHSARPSMNRPEHVTPNAGQGQFVTGIPSLRSGSTPPLG
jgi:hypothetical protein